MRLRIDLAYDGGAFKGWAAQPGLRTVQGELVAAVRTVLRVPDDEPLGPREVVCAGRTDAGVHARGQVVHADVRDLDTDEVDRLPRRLNGVLPPDVRVRGVRVAPDGFDARFGALWRRYAYRVADDVSLLDPLTRGHVLAWPRPLDLDAMNAAAEHLVGRHDFASFCKQREGATTIRTLLDLHWTRDAAGVATATVRADAFCHSMVRALVGCLLAVGEGRKEPAWAGEMLHAQRRDPAVAVVHAHGLTLEEVVYPGDAELAERAEQTRAKRAADDVDSPTWTAP
ncbi:MAG: tRNA pseudouridine(38-40) synthase TruA [Nocardioides sp.]|nr:tRNA pseudouridine(38-40) synthase TruA [Nocardioides sp.]